MMRLPVPLHQRFHHVLRGAALGGSWGWIHNSIRPHPTESHPPDSNPLSEFQSFSKTVNDAEGGRVFDDRNVIFLQFVQLIQTCVQTHCQQRRIPYVETESVTPDAALISRFSPWISALILTLLKGQQSETSLLESLASHSSLFPELSDNSPRDADQCPSHPSRNDLIGISLLSQALLSCSPACGSGDSLVLSTLLADWQQWLVEHDIKTEWMSLLLPLEADYHRQRPLAFVASHLQQQGLTPQSTAIAIAWYALRAAPYSPALSLTRAVSLSPDPALSGLLTGLWINLYNGEIDLAPTSGQAKITLQSLGNSQVPSLAAQSLKQSATQLFATWAGIVSPHPIVLDEASLLQITAPRRLYRL